MAENRNRALNLLDFAAGKLLQTLDPRLKDQQYLSTRDAEIQAIINDSISMERGVSNGNIVDFAMNIIKDTENRSDNLSTSKLLATDDITTMFGMYKETYRNRYLEIADLKFISRFIPGINESVKTTLNAICSSDGMATTITRQLILPEGLTPEERAEVTTEIERIEQELKLLRKLKNVTYYRTMIAGTDYIYCIPYEELFTEYDQLIASGDITNEGTIRSKGIASALSKEDNNPKTAGFNTGRKNTKAPAMESIDNILSSIGLESITSDLIGPMDKALSKGDKDTIKSNIVDVISNFEIIDTHALTEALEEIHMIEKTDSDLSPYRKSFGKNEEVDSKTSDTEMAYNTNTGTSGKRRSAKFNTPGAYIKYISAGKLVPVMLHDRPIGYLHALSSNTSQSALANIADNTSESSIMSSSQSIFGNVNVSDKRRDNTTRAIVDKISDEITRQFSVKFVNKNAEFKQTIADSIIANGLVNANTRIQFIPAKYIIPFTITPDERGYGQSSIKDALLPGKILSQILTAKVLFYINKTGNKTMVYARKGEVDPQTTNQSHRVVRMLQEGNVTFSDLMSPNLSFNKFSRYGGLLVPTAANGDRLFDIETVEGQSVDLNTPMEEFLLRLTMLGTPTPSILIDYTDTADYARSIVTATIKHAEAVSGFQADLEEPTTDLYRTLLQCSNLRDDLKERVVPQFEFKLARPRVLANVNMGDYLSQVQAVAESIANIKLGQNADTPDAVTLRTQYISDLAPVLLPFAEWAEYDAILKTSKIKVVQDKDLDSSDGDTEEE